MRVIFAPNVTRQAFLPTPDKREIAFLQLWAYPSDFCPQRDQTGFSSYPGQGGDCISAVLGLPEEPDFILHKLHSLWGDLVFVDKECQSFDGHCHLFPLGQVRVPENTPSQPAKNTKEKVLVVTDELPR